MQETTRIYLGKVEVARTLGVHEQTVHAMERDGELIEPDIVIGLGMAENGYQFRGYARERVIEFGKATGRLNDDGEPHLRGTGMVHATRPVPLDEHGQPPAWWRADTRWYLSRSDLAPLWGVKPRSVTMRAQRGQMPHADVALNTTMARGTTYGYDPALIGHRSRQMGLTVAQDPMPYQLRAMQQRPLDT